MENNITQIDLIAPSLVTKKRQSPVEAITYLAAGAAIASLRYLVPAIAGSSNLSSTVMIIGWGLLLFGIVKLIIAMYGNSWHYFYTPTGERIVMRDLSFDLTHKDKVCGLVKAGDFEALSKISRSNISSVKVTLGILGNKNIAWAQVFEFVPHTHVPITEVLSFSPTPMPRALM